MNYKYSSASQGSSKSVVNVIKQVIPNETIVKIVGSITDPAKQVGPAGLPNRYLNFTFELLSGYF